MTKCLNLANDKYIFFPFYIVFCTRFAVSINTKGKVKLPINNFLFSYLLTIE